MRLKPIVIGLVCSLLFLSSCDKEEQTVGIEMLPDSDFLITCIDSVSTKITYTTVQDDSVRSSLITYMVGENNDEAFGRTRAGYATRMYLQGMIGDLLGYKLDSAVFRLSKSAKYYYGDTTVAQSFSIYELKNDITVEDCKNYNQKGTVPTCISAKEEIMTFNVPAYKDTVSSYTQKMNVSYATDLYERVLSCYNVNETLQHADSLFIKKFKGLYVTTKGDQFNNVNAVVTHCIPEIKFYLSGNDTTAVLTYAPSPQAYDDPLSSDPSQIYLQAVNIFEHDYPSGISFGTVDSKAYVQGMMGLKAKLLLDGLDNWRDSVMVINIAKLTLPLEKRDSWSGYLPLNLRIYDSQRNLIFSTMSATTDSTNFEFNMHGFLVNFLNSSKKSDTYSYEITVPENNTYGNAFVLEGTESDKLKLVITYTK
ncbi:MAG: DUF4270 domain-containing protein [Bacteroidales bacterium]|nr:DUF4270 domain-containing protein [Bacteroidales bacterium]